MAREAKVTQPSDTAPSSDTAQDDTAQDDTAQSDTAQDDTAQSDTAQDDTAQSDTAQADDTGPRQSLVVRGGQRLLSSPVRVFVVSFIVSALLLVAWSIATPMFGSSDEETHMARAVALVHGQFVGGTVHSDKDPYTTISVPEVYAHIYGPCFAFQTTSAACQTLAVPHPHRDVKTLTYVGRYPPFYYAVVGLPTLAVTSVTGMYLMRIVSCLLSSLFIALAIMSVFCWSRRRLLQVGVLLALTPTTMFYAASVNPNGFEIVVAICLWCTAIILATERIENPPRGLVAVVAVSAAALMVARGISPLWVAVILVVMVILATPKALFRLVRRRRDVQLWILLLVAVGAFALVWIYSVHSLDLQPDATGAVPPDRQLLHLYALTLGLSESLLRETIGAFGWDRVASPLITYLIWYGVLGFVIVSAIIAGVGRALVALVATIGCLILAPALLSASQIPPDGIGWAGRYTLPVAVGIPLLAMTMIDGSDLAIRAKPKMISVICVAIAIADAAAFTQALRQSSVGATGSLNYFNGSWSPPIGDVAATVWGVVGVALFALLCWSLARAPGVPLALATDEGGQAEVIVVQGVRYKVASSLVSSEASLSGPADHFAELSEPEESRSARVGGSIITL